jgi:adenylate cyclase
VSDFGGTFDPLADAVGAASDGLDLRAVLLAAGVPRDDVDRAVEEGTLELLAFERMVATEPPQYSLDEVSGLSGVAPERIRSYWRAMGFPDPRPGEKLFTDSDLAMLSDVLWFIAHGALDPNEALQMARVVGSSLERIARAQVETIATRQAAAVPVELPGPEVATHPWDGDGDAPVDALAIRRGTDLLPLMPKLMDFVWRRHVMDAARRRRLRASSGQGATVCVGFADLVGFTAQSMQLDEEELADVVGRFEAIAYDVVSSHRGRVVKMIGDEVMFLSEGVRSGAELALALAEAYRNEDALSDVRVGLASGPVLEREGDVYGPVVNLASRIVGVAWPATVVVSDDVHEALADDPRLLFRPIRAHDLKDIGRVPLWTMRRPGDQLEELRRRAGERTAGRAWPVRARSGARLPRPVEEEVAGILSDAGLLRAARDGALVNGDEPTREFEAITDVVLAAEIDEDLQVELLADIEVARRLTRLEREAQVEAEAVDHEVEDRLAAIEEEVRLRVEAIEDEARRRIDEALAEAEQRAAEVNAEIARRAEQVAEATDRKAREAEHEARRVAEGRAAARRRPGGTPRPDGPDGPDATGGTAPHRPAGTGWSLATDQPGWSPASDDAAT